MDEYIERGALLKEWPLCDEPGDAYCFVRNFPATDVHPVIHGHWISEKEAEEMDDYSRRDTCSVCGHCDWDCTESKYFSFCPNCGADMREAPDA